MNDTTITESKWLNYVFDENFEFNSYKNKNVNTIDATNEISNMFFKVRSLNSKTNIITQDALEFGIINEYEIEKLDEYMESYPNN